MSENKSILEDNKIRRYSNEEADRITEECIRSASVYLLAENDEENNSQSLFNALFQIVLDDIPYFTAATKSGMQRKYSIM